MNKLNIKELKILENKIMKIKYNFVLCLFLVINQLTFSQITFHKNIDDKDIVATLFETKYNPKDSTFKWIPNVSESVQFTGEHTKDTLFTKIDTVFNYKENDAGNRLILTSTNTSNSNCHACQPSLGLIELSLNEEKQEYQLNYVQKFVTKYGTWGETPKKRSIFKIAEDVFCLKITEYYMGGGVEVEQTSLFRDGKKIFSFKSYLSETAFGNEKLNSKYSTTLYYDKKNNTVKITKKGKDAIKEVVRNGETYLDVVPVNQISSYKYDGEFLTKISTINLIKK